MRIEVIESPFGKPIRVDVDGVPYFQESDTRLCHRKTVREDDLMPQIDLCSVCDCLLDGDTVFCPQCGAKVVEE